MVLRILAAFAAITCANATHAQTVQLIKPEEAKLPAAAAQPASRAITRGPAIKLTSPESVAGTFAFKVAFEPRGGSKIDPASVKVEYLKEPVVDLTQRVKPGLKPDGIELASVAAPAGEHPIPVSGRDSESRPGPGPFRLKGKQAPMRLPY